MYFLFVFTIFSSIVLSTEANDSCGCYILGTMSSVEGESICDDNFQCKCFPNVVGKNCSACAEGFYGILSGRGCKDCKCNPVGSVGRSCNGLTGECQCKPGYSGYRCDPCEAFSFEAAPGKCEKCNCNPYGSKDLQCDAMGQCACRQNVLGRFCHQCPPNTENVERGCQPCFGCFTFVQEAVEYYTDFLKNTEKAITKVEDDLPILIQKHSDFLGELRGMRQKIINLKGKCEGDTTTVTIAEYTKLKKEANNFHNRVVALTSTVSSNLFYWEIKSLISTGVTNLNNANSLLRKCDDALEKAMIAMHSLYKHNETITKLVEESIEVVDTIVKEADELYDLSVDVATACTETCQVAKDLAVSQSNTRKQIQELWRDTRNQSASLETIKMSAEDLSMVTNTINDKIMTVSKKVNMLTIPTTNGEVTIDLDMIATLLKYIDKNATVLDDEFQKLKEKEQSTVLTLMTVKEEQKLVDGVLSDLQGFNDRIEKALAQKNEIVEKVKKNMASIEEFKKLREEAKEAMKRVPAIQDKVNVVLNNSAEIKKIFVDLSKSVFELQELQKKVSELMKSLVQTGNDTKLNVQEVIELEEKENNIQERLKNHSEKIKGVRSNLHEMQKYQKQVEMDISHCENYIIVLETLPTTNEQLDEVESQIVDMEEMLNTKEHLEQVRNKLKAEVENIKDIIESLPLDSNNLCSPPESEPK